MALHFQPHRLFCLLPYCRLLVQNHFSKPRLFGGCCKGKGDHLKRQNFFRFIFDLFFCALRALAIIA
jgi:hypothetical protein